MPSTAKAAIGSRGLVGHPADDRDHRSRTATSSRPPASSSSRHTAPSAPRAASATAIASMRSGRSAQRRDQPWSLFLAAGVTRATSGSASVSPWPTSRRAGDATGAPADVRRELRPPPVTGRSQTNPRHTYAVGSAVDERPVGQQRHARLVGSADHDHRARWCVPAGRPARSWPPSPGGTAIAISYGPESIASAAAAAYPANRGWRTDQRGHAVQRPLGRLAVADVTGQRRAR